MIKKLLFLLILIAATFVSVEAKTQWVKIGEGTYNQGFIYPYKLSLYVPYGVRNIHDIKQMQYEMKFKLDWLLMEASDQQVIKIFRQQLKENFSSTENFKLYTHVIESFLNSLSSIKKHNQWAFIYSPDVGTRLYINEKEVHHLVGSDINKALMNSWLKKDPVLTSNLFTRLLKVQK